MNDVVDVVFIDLHGAVINNEYLERRNAGNIILIDRYKKCRITTRFISK